MIIFLLQGYMSFCVVLLPLQLQCRLFVCTDPIALACSECYANEEKPFPLRALQAEVLSCQASQIISWFPVKAAFFHPQKFFFCCFSQSREVKNYTIGYHRAIGLQLNYLTKAINHLSHKTIFRLLPVAFQSNNQCLFYDFFRAGA